MLRIVIPARYEASRFPGKLLKEVGDMPIILHTYQRALAAQVDSVVIATDDQRIAEVATAAGAEVFLSQIEHSSGTERIAEVVQTLAYDEQDIVINLQADEPFIQPQLLRQAAENLKAHPAASMSTIYLPLDKAEDVFNPNIVKVVLDKDNYALYFSRAPIPWLRGVFDQQRSEFALESFHRHIGIYTYRASFVKQYRQLAVSPLEQYESLEQLRVLWNGYKIVLSEASVLPGQEVNTEEDLQKARAIYAATQG